MVEDIVDDVTPAVAPRRRPLDMTDNFLLGLFLAVAIPTCGWSPNCGSCMGEIESSVPGGDTDG